MQKIVLGFLFLSFANFAMAATKNCSDFNLQASAHDRIVIQRQKQLDQVDQQIHSNQKAVGEMGQKCKTGSQPNCSPMLFNMIAQQTTVLSGQRQKLSDQILKARMEREEALQNFKSCKQIAHGKLESH